MDQPTAPWAPRLAARARALMQRGRRQVVRWVRLAIRLWRRSLLIRVVGLTTVLCVCLAGFMMAFVSTHLKNQIFQTRHSQIQGNAQDAMAMFQGELSASAATSEGAMSAFVSSLLGRLDNEGVSQKRRVVFLAPATTPRPGSDQVQSPTPTQAAPERNPAIPSIDPVPERVISDYYGTNPHALTPALIDTVKANGNNLYVQSTALQKDGQKVPGIVAGQAFDIPLLGLCQLYFVYSLEPENQTLRSAQGALVIGTMLLVIMVACVVALVTRQVVRPVRAVAHAAHRFQTGHLDERMTVKGEDDVAQLQKAFNDMAATLSGQLTRLEALGELQRGFVADVSHELRTPLTTIRMAADVIFESRDALDPLSSRSAELLHEQVERFDSLLAELLEISRFDAGQATADLTQVDITALLDSIAADVSPHLVDYGTTLSIHGLPGRCMVQGDARRLARVFRNLIVNAVEHAERKPVDVFVNASEDTAAVVVRDYGVGLTYEELGKVFDRFWRADPARTRTLGGSGLGLAISKADVELHGGKIDVWGNKGEGAAFRVTLPRAYRRPLGPSPLPMLITGECDDPRTVPTIEGAPPTAAKRPLAQENTEESS